MKRKKHIQKELKDNEALAECAEQFGLVGDPTRMKICWLLCKHPELSVGDIAELLDVSSSLVSHSLRKLKENNLVDARRERKQVYYRLADTGFNRLLKKTLKNV